MPTPDPHYAYELAGDLLADLAEHIGDADAVAEVLTEWAADLDPGDLALTVVAAVWRTFTECLHHVSPADVPPGAVAFTDRRSA